MTDHPSCQRRLPQRRRLSLLLAAAVAAVASPLFAETPATSSVADINASVRETRLAEERAPRPGSAQALGQSLYKTLTTGQSADATEPVLRSALKRGGEDCGQISTWQVYRLGTASRTLKIKCAAKHLYALTVTIGGDMQFSGGDGSIAPMIPSDGRIISVYGRRAEDYLREAGVENGPEVVPAAPKGPAAANVSIDDPDSSARPTAVVPVAAPVTSASGDVTEPLSPPGMLAPWVVWAITFNVVALSVIGWFAAHHLKTRRLAMVSLGPDPAWGLTSDDKDYMLDESHELYPNIFSHPKGFFIARGRRGKRRLFRFAFTAMLYRDFGLKIAEIDCD